MIAAFSTFTGLHNEDRGWTCAAFGAQQLRAGAECLVVCFQRHRIQEGMVVPVRLQSACITSEIFGSTRCDCAWQLRHAQRFVRRKGLGVVIYFPQHEGCGHGLMAKLECLAVSDRGLTSTSAYAALGYPVDSRSFDMAVDILHGLGVTHVDLLTNNPAKLQAVAKGGFEEVRRVPSRLRTLEPSLRAYLRAKREDLGHLP